MGCPECGAKEIEKIEHVYVPHVMGAYFAHCLVCDTWWGAGRKIFDPMTEPFLKALLENKREEKNEYYIKEQAEGGE